MFGIAVAAILIDSKIRPLIFSVSNEDNNNAEFWRDDLDELLEKNFIGYLSFSSVAVYFTSLRCCIGLLNRSNNRIIVMN